MADKTQPLMAVLIDADNIPAKHAAAILEEITRYGEPALRRVYGDWASDGLKGWRDQVKKLGLVAQQETANTAGKNASDIGLVIDAMDILHKGLFDKFVLVSSDSDFTALANRLREDGVEVIGIGENKTPDSLRKVCNLFVQIENIVDQVSEEVAKKATSKPTNSNSKTPPSKVVPLVRKAMKDLDPDAEWIGLGAVGSQISRANPDFDVRTFGSSKLSDLLRLTGQFEVKSVDDHLRVRLKR